MPTFYVFRGIGAIVVGVKKHTTLTVVTVPDNTVKADLSAGRRFDVDLTATPKRGAWASVRFDDRGVDMTNHDLPAARDASTLNLGVTSIGSPHLVDDAVESAFVGSLYIEDGAYKQLYPSAIASQTNPTPWPPKEYALYELTSVAYQSGTDDPRAGRRYHGFRVAVVDAKNSLASVMFFLPDKTQYGPFWIDLTNVAECDPSPSTAALAGATSIAASPTVGTQGALFVNLTRASALGITGPKLPIGLD